MMAASFDLVAVRIVRECAVVVRVVVRPEARRAIVLGARLDRGLVERIDRLAALGDKGDVRAALLVRLLVQLCRLADPEARLVRFAVAVRDDALAGNVDGVDAAVAERLQRGVIECLRLLQVRNADRNVIDHRRPPNGGIPPPIPPMPPPFISAAMPERIRPFCPSLLTCFIMRAISMCCFSSLFTSCTCMPLPLAMRFLREALMRSGLRRSFAVIEEMIASERRITLSSTRPSSCFCILPRPGSMPAMEARPPIFCN